MSKAKEKEVKLPDGHVAEPNLDFQGKTNAELEEVKNTLIEQLNQYNTMAIKASGAIEVINQLIGEENPTNES